MGRFGTSSSYRTSRRLAVFIDASNFLAGYKDLSNKKILHYESLIDLFLSHQWKRRNGIIFEHIKTFYYTSKGIPNKVKEFIEHEEIENFTDSLLKNHVKIISKEKRNGKEKGVDVALAVDLVALAFSNAYDYAIIVSGDEDFISAIDEVKRYGKIIYFASFKSRFSDNLLMHIDDVIYLDSFFSAI